MPKNFRQKKAVLPRFFKPLLWSFDWHKLDVQEDKEDIILAAINEGRMIHWQWLVKTYGRPQIRRILSRRLASEFHPESRHLARIIFSVPRFRTRRSLSK